ncbi:helix-turn-helix domain-containing protein [Mesorhizobium sp.]|uniref:helix-turn-helix domain-containing protein n=1 Tax=Mesorhizobium sp. TaxID=1871066 RepID=UPI000FE4EB69|nr:MAG: DNA-binding protein [Mesorhizobium sp.]
MPNVYSPRTLANSWGCSERHIRNLINAGQLRAFRVGKLLRIEPKAVEDYQCRNTVSDDLGENSAPSTMTPPATVTAIRLAQITR